MALSVLVLVQMLPQSMSGGVQVVPPVQAPAVQVWPPVHTLLQVPQLLLSVCRLTQVLPQSEYPPLHGNRLRRLVPVTKSL